MHQDRSLEFLKGASGLKSEFVEQLTPSNPISLERVDLAAAAIHREHQLAAETLPQRVLANERLKLAHHSRVLARRQIGIDPILERGQPRLLQTGDLRLRKRLIGKVRERRAAPQPQCLAQDSGGGQRVAVVERPPALPH